MRPTFVCPVCDGISHLSIWEFGPAAAPSYQSGGTSAYSAVLGAAAGSRKKQRFGRGGHGINSLGNCRDYGSDMDGVATPGLYVSCHLIESCVMLAAGRRGCRSSYVVHGWKHTLGRSTNSCQASERNDCCRVARDEMPSVGPGGCMPPKCVQALSFASYWRSRHPSRWPQGCNAHDASCSRCSTPFLSSFPGASQARHARPASASGVALISRLQSAAALRTSHPHAPTHTPARVPSQAEGLRVCVLGGGGWGVGGGGRYCLLLIMSWLSLQALLQYLTALL